MPGGERQPQSPADIPTRVLGGVAPTDSVSTTQVGSNPVERAVLPPDAATHITSTTAEQVRAQPVGDAVPLELPAGSRYVIGEPLGSGGGGRVMVATDGEIGRTVALKTLKPSGLLRDESIQRFREEARMTARLEHPNIIPIYDVGNLGDGQPYYTMRIVQRRSLRDVLRLPVPREAWPLARLCTVFVQVCRAVAYAHARGVVHRDLKPDNILLGDFGEVYVADWGIAKLLADREEKPAEELEDLALGHTAMGAAKGTPGYMAPEVASGEGAEVDRRADLFALGVMLYEIICGRHPFKPATGSSNRAEVLYASAHEDPVPPHDLVSSCPLVLEQLCLSLLAKEKQHRPESAELVATEVEAFLEGAKEKERRRREAARLVEEARQPLQRYEALNDTRRRLLEEAMAKKSGMKPWEPLERKRDAWVLEDKAGEVASQQAKALAEAQDLYQHALAHDPESAVAHAALADLYWSLARRAENERREPTRIYYESMVRDHDNGRYAVLLSADARVSLESNPPGAEVVAYRYLEVDHVLRASEERRLGRTPIVEARFAPGSYLLVLRRPGTRDVRYPVRCRRGEHHLGIVNLYTDAQIGAGFVYVPGGPTVIGGDDEARGQPLPRTEAFVDDFAIAELPVTFGEYLQFLNELQARDPEACRRRLPIGKDGRMPVRQDEHGEWVLDYEDLVEGEGRRFCPVALGNKIPMMPLSYFDARAYAEWHSARTGVAVRLPREVEFEKAARGVDERIFPWGNRFDATFAKMRESRPGFPQPEPAGAFATDESPYGVRDLGGGMACWMGDLHGEVSLAAASQQEEPPAGSPLELSGERFHRGGCWLAAPEGCRAASRVRYFGSFRPSECGIRLARSLAPAEM